MTVSTTIIKSFGTGDGSTATFAYQFKIIQDSDLEVFIRTNSTGAESAAKVLGTDYSMTGAGVATGGTVTFLSGKIPISGQTIVLRRNVPKTQVIDYIANDPFPAETHEEGLDRGIMVAQQNFEEVERSIKLSKTNTMSSTEFKVGAAERANKVLSFDSTGELSVTQELGTFKGNSATTTTAAYAIRDIVKGTTAAQLNNIYICIKASPIGTALTNTTFWVLLVDAVSAATSAAASAASATTSGNSATASANSATASANSATTSGNSATASANSATASANSATAAAASADAFDDIYLGTKSSDPSTDNDGDALAAGMLYFNSSSNLIRVYNGSSWQNAAVDTTGFTTLTGVETLTNKTLTLPKINENVAVTSTATELNLLDGVSGLVQADLTKLAAIDASAAEIDTLDALSRGSIIYGNASAATAVLTKGSANTVLTSDGTDISWVAASGGGTDWQAVKTANFTAVAGEGYFVNTTSSTITITLPSSPSIGDEIEFTDYTRTWGNANKFVTININGKKFQSGTVNPVLNESGQSFKIVYSDATEGWIPVIAGAVANEAIISYTLTQLTVAGGAGGGLAKPGGGGAGGMLTSAVTVEENIQLTVSVGNGGGGAGNASAKGGDGGNSSIVGTGFTNITAIGGGGGGSDQNTAGADGGSGGGGSGEGDSAGGDGTSGQGNDGGTGISGGAAAGGGGGGKNAAGANGTSNTGGNGGAGLASSITGSAVTYAGGGGGANENAQGGSGGAGGGGAGSQGNGTAGTANTGGGGGASHEATAAGGGSGIVVLSMPDANYSGTVTGSPTVATNVGGNGQTTVKFTGDGTYTT
jgi:hypothetical protein